MKSPELQDEEQPKLKITEVFMRWDYEWIEITNISDKDFSWKLSLSWVKKSVYETKKINIPAYTSVIISDKWDTGIVNKDNIVISDAGLVMSDTNGLSIQLSYSSWFIDDFAVSESTVSWNKNKTPRPSFQKIYNDGEREIQATTAEDSFNITWNFIANPW
jgi:hypothetical protein